MSGSLGPVVPAVATWLGIINLVTIERFWIDKRRAERGTWRVPEATLLFLSAIGGTPGALLARHLLRHKTRKEPFSTRLQVIAVVQLGILGVLALP